MPTLAPDHTPSDVAYASRQGQPAPVSPALAHQLSLSELLTEFSALKTQLAAQDAEITALKSQLATQVTQNAPSKSAIPQSEISNLKSEIPNLQSSICNLQSDIPHSAFPIPHSDNPAFAPLYAREVKHYLPGGDWIMPPMPAAALTRQAHIQRLNYLSTRCELALIERVDRFAVCGIVGPPEGETFAFIMHHLSRLTSIYKSITALENDPTIPVGPVQDDLTNLATSIMRDPAASTGVPPSGGIASPSSNSQPDLEKPAMTSVGSVQSVESVGSSLPQSEIPNPQAPSAIPSTPGTPGVPATHSTPAIRQIPQCPTFSPERLARTLDQTATALDVSSAGILPAHPATVANPQTPSPTLGARTSRPPYAPSANAPSSTPEIEPLPLTPSHTSHPSHSSPSPQSNIPHSAFRIPHSAFSRARSPLPPRQHPHRPLRPRFPVRPAPAMHRVRRRTLPLPHRRPHLLRHPQAWFPKVRRRLPFLLPQTPAQLPLYPPQIPRRTQRVGRVFDPTLLWSAAA